MLAVTVYSVGNGSERPLQTELWKRIAGRDGPDCVDYSLGLELNLIDVIKALGR